MFVNQGLAFKMNADNMSLSTKHSLLYLLKIMAIFTLNVNNIMKFL